MECITKSAVQQAIDTAYPFEKQGFVIWSDDAPDVVADPLLAYFIWGKTVLDVPNKEFYFYNGTSWELIPLVDGALLADGSVPLTKLSLVGSSPYFIVQVNSLGTALIWTSIASAIQNNTIPPAKLLISDNVNSYVLTSIAGVKNFTLISDLVTLITDNTLPTSKLIRGAADALGLYLRTKLDGTDVEWARVDVANLGATAGNNNKSIRRKSDDTGWEYFTPAVSFVPTFIAPVTVYGPLAGASGWTTYNAGGSIPVAAIAALLQITTKGGSAGTSGEIKVNIRKDNTSPVLIGGYNFDNTGDFIISTVQGIFPLTTDKKFDFEVVTVDTSTATIELIGYFA